MTIIPGVTFKVIKPKMDFVLGESYRVYHISPVKEGVEYIFQTKNGPLKTTFDSTEQAEAIIKKMTGK